MVMATLVAAAKIYHHAISLFFIFMIEWARNHSHHEQQQRRTQFPCFSLFILLFIEIHLIFYRCLFTTLDFIYVSQFIGTHAASEISIVRCWQWPFFMDCIYERFISVHWIHKWRWPPSPHSHYKQGVLFCFALFRPETSVTSHHYHHHNLLFGPFGSFGQQMGIKCVACSVFYYPVPACPSANVVYVCSARRWWCWRCQFAQNASHMQIVPEHPHVCCCRVHLGQFCSLCSCYAISDWHSHGSKLHVVFCCASCRGHVLFLSRMRTHNQPSTFFALLWSLIRSLFLYEPQQHQKVHWPVDLSAGVPGHTSSTLATDCVKTLAAILCFSLLGSERKMPTNFNSFLPFYVCVCCFV